MMMTHHVTFSPYLVCLGPSPVFLCGALWNMRYPWEGVSFWVDDIIIRNILQGVKRVGA